MPYKLSNEAKMDLARIYWRGVEEFGELQADCYYEALIQRFGDIAEAPYKYQSVDHIRARGNPEKKRTSTVSVKAIGVVFAAWTVFTFA